MGKTPLFCGRYFPFLPGGVPDDPHGAHGFQQANYSAGFPYNHDEPNEYNRAYSAKHTKSYHDNMVISFI